MDPRKSRHPVLLMLLLASLLMPGSAQARAQVVGALGLGESVFWDAAAAVADADGNRKFLLQVEESGGRLRIALDRRNFGASLQVRAPDGTTVPVVGYWLTLEAFADEALTGTWRLTVTRANDARQLRLRARLEDPAADPAAGEATPLLPNLQMIPPFGITTAAEEVPTHRPRALDETNCADAPQQAIGDPECMRVGLGPINAGSGPLILQFSVPSQDGGGSVTQVVEDRAGTEHRRAAGTYAYHASHLHYHYPSFAKVELFQVLNRSTVPWELRLVTAGPSRWSCVEDIAMAPWRSFQQPRHPQASPCAREATAFGVNLPIGTATVLNAGWSDPYWWNEDGLGLPAGALEAGSYLIRAEVDPYDAIAESSEGDNVSYALLSFAEGDLDVIERAHGEGPWDPNASYADDNLAPTR